MGKAEVRGDSLERRTYYFIINPAAKNAGSLKVWEKTKETLDREGISYSYAFTEYKGHGVALAREFLQSTGDAILVAVGGDGTIHEVANGAAGFPGVRIAYIPAGSGNDFARGEGIDSRPLQALSGLLHSNKVRPIDLGFYKTSSGKGYLLNSLGIGLDAAITEAVNQSRMKHYFNKLGAGKIIYLAYFLWKWMTYKPGEMEVEIDGESHSFTNTWLVNVSNHPYFGGGIKISPNAKPDDGVFHILVIHNIPRIKLLLMFSTVLWGGHLKLRGVDSFEGRTIRVTSSFEVPIQADGENVGAGEAFIELKHHMVKLAVQGE
ncbi:diacylglycerol/lipid kinase family protein [Gracilibacillus sp. Marseille-QA3620]